MNYKFMMKNGELTDKAIYRFENGGYLEITIHDAESPYNYMIKVIEYDKNGDVVGQVDEDNGIIASEVWYIKLGHVEERYDIMTDVDYIAPKDKHGNYMVMSTVI